MAKTLEVFGRIKKKDPGFVIAMDVDDKKGLGLSYLHMGPVELTMLHLETSLHLIQLTKQTYTICRSAYTLELTTTSRVSYLPGFYLPRRL
jgi:hypothetical protein